MRTSALLVEQPSRENVAPGRRVERNGAKYHQLTVDNPQLDSRYRLYVVVKQ